MHNVLILGNLISYESRPISCQRRAVWQFVWQPSLPISCWENNVTL